MKIIQPRRRVASRPLEHFVLSVAEPVPYISMDNTGEQSSQFADGHAHTQQVASSVPITHTNSPVPEEWATPSRRWSSSSIPVPTPSLSTSRSRYYSTTPGAHQMPDLPTAPAYTSAARAANPSVTPSPLEPLILGPTQTLWPLAQPRSYTPEPSTADSIYSLQESRPASRQSSTQYPSEPGSLYSSASSSPATFAHRTAPPLPSLVRGFRSGSPVGSSVESLPSLHRSHADRLQSRSQIPRLQSTATSPAPSSPRAASCTCACTCQTKPKPKRRSPRTPTQKLDQFFDFLDKDLDWSYGMLLYHVSRLEDEKGQPVHRSHKHAAVISKFYRGQSTFTPADLLFAFLRTPDGIPQTDEEKAQMYSLDTPYTEIKLVRPAITSFAVQTTYAKLVKERNTAVKPTSGLHTSRTKRTIAAGNEYEQISAKMLRDVVTTLKTHQALTYEILVRLAEPKVRNGVVAIRTVRPPHQVSCRTETSIHGQKFSITFASGFRSRPTLLAP